MAEATWAVIVARVSNGAKSRLAAVLEPPERRRLVVSMLSDVLHACASSSALAGSIAVLDTDPEARAVAISAGALLVDDPGGMNAAATAGIGVARQRGATTTIVLPADIPLICPADIEELLAAAGSAQRAVVIGASRDGQGTNALLLRPPEVIAPAFGPPSVRRHCRDGKQSGADTRVLFHLGLALDVDTPADLADYRESLLTAVSRGMA